MIGKSIRQLRQENKMSITELADRAGVAKSYLSKIERDIQTNPSIQFLEKIASALKVTVDDILHPHVQLQEGVLDKQWYELVREAMASGIAKEQFREFLELNKWRIDIRK